MKTPWARVRRRRSERDVSREGGKGTEKVDARVRRTNTETVVDVRGRRLRGGKNARETENEVEEERNVERRVNDECL